MFPRCPLRVIRVGFVMSAVGPVYPQQQTISDPRRDFAFGLTADFFTRYGRQPTWRGCLLAIGALPGRWGSYKADGAALGWLDRGAMTPPS